MEPLLSVIIVHYNDHDKIHLMLDSLREQSIAGRLEVVIADTGSEKPCNEIVDRYRGLGLNIRAIHARHRQSQLIGRLAGLSATSAPAVFFPDADDHLIGNDILETHVRRLLDEDIDILNYRFMYYYLDQSGQVSHEEIAGDAGLGKELYGPEIFSAFASPKAHAPNMWSKIYSRKLCQKVAALPFVHHPDFFGAEDQMFNVLAMFHARSYKSSPLVGYGYFFPFKSEIKWGLSSLGTLLFMKNQVLPYMLSQGCPRADVEAYGRRISYTAHNYVMAMSADLVKNGGLNPPEELFQTLLERNGPRKLAEIFMAFNPAAECARLAKENAAWAGPVA